MKKRIITELNIEADKMAGLRLRDTSLPSNQGTISIRGWDDKRESSVSGVIDGKTIQVIPPEFIESEFRSFDEAGAPIPCAQRAGNLGRPKTLGSIRLGTTDGVNYILSLCDKNGITIADLHEGELLSDKELHITTMYGSKSFRIYDAEKHRSKINKILEKHNQ